MDIGDALTTILIYCALVAEDLAHGVRLAVNHGGDSDSTGAVTGNILGALWGEAAIPTGWLDQVEMRQKIETLAADAVRLVLRGETEGLEGERLRYTGRD